jgi:hypothetical protein
MCIHGLAKTTKKLNNASVLGENICIIEFTYKYSRGSDKSDLILSTVIRIHSHKIDFSQSSDNG